MAKANCGASMKPQQKNTPKMAKGGYAGKSRMAMGGMMGNMQQRKAPQSVQAMTAQSSAGARRNARNRYS